MSDDDREKKEFLLTLDAFFAVVSAIGDYTLFSCHKITDYLEVEKQLSDKWTELESLTTLPLARPQIGLALRRQPRLQQGRRSLGLSKGGSGLYSPSQGL